MFFCPDVQLRGHFTRAAPPRGLSRPAAREGPGAPKLAPERRARVGVSPRALALARLSLGRAPPGNPVPGRGRRGAR
eukprot:1706552-Alexandrium_andersonii.AAC.1